MPYSEEQHIYRNNTLQTCSRFLRPRYGRVPASKQPSAAVKSPYLRF